MFGRDLVAVLRKRLRIVHEVGRQQRLRSLESCVGGCTSALQLGQRQRRSSTIPLHAHRLQRIVEDLLALDWRTCAALLQDRRERGRARHLVLMRADPRKSQSDGVVRRRRYYRLGNAVSNAVRWQCGSTDGPRCWVQAEHCARARHPTGGSTAWTQPLARHRADGKIVKRSTSSPDDQRRARRTPGRLPDSCGPRHRSGPAAIRGHHPAKEAISPVSILTGSPSAAAAQMEHSHRLHQCRTRCLYRHRTRPRPGNIHHLGTSASRY